MDSEETLPVAQRSERLVSSLEIWLRSSDGAVRAYPFCRLTLTVGPPGPGIDVELNGSPRISLTWQEGRVRFRNETPLAEVLQAGEVVLEGELAVGGTLEVGGHQLQLWDREGPQAYMEGFSDPFSGRLWPLLAGTHTVGRSGQRVNSVALDHPTVSRAHACLRLHEQVATVLAESTTNPVVVNGQDLRPGESAALKDGDLLEFGELLFRFHQPVRSAGLAREGIPRLRARLLGGFALQIGDTTLAEKSWKTQNVRWLTARLAFAAGKPVDVDTLLELLWPELPADRARKNLNYSLYVLRQTLRELSGCGADYVLRSSQWLQLNPQHLESSDLEALELALRQDAGEQVLELYTGPFLEGCYLDWSLRQREHYALQVLEAGRRRLARYGEGQQWEGVLQLGTRLLQLDSCCQLTCQLMMQAHLARSSPGDALKLFESCRKQLKAELDAEPSIEVLREYHRAQALL